MTVYGYVRVSTNSQENKGTSLSTQTKMLKAQGAQKLYKDVKSGASLDRPELQKLLGKLVQGDTLLVCRFDRFARNTKDLLEMVEQLNQKGVVFRSLHENIDTSTPIGKMFITVIGAIAEFERNTILERTKTGRQRYVENGGKLGRKATNQERLDLAKQELIRLGDYETVSQSTKIPKGTLYRLFPAREIDRLRQEHEKGNH